MRSQRDLLVRRALIEIVAGVSLLRLSAADWGRRPAPGVTLATEGVLTGRTCIPLMPADAREKSSERDKR
jgi:hypothetical protein